MKRRVWEIVEAAKPGDTASRAFDLALLLLILLNVVAVVVGSIRSVQVQYGLLLDRFETVSVIVFSMEYAARIWSCTADTRFRGMISGRIRQATRPMTLIDLASIVPFYMPMLGLDLRSLRAFRLLRVLRIARIGRYYASLAVIRDVFASKKEELVLTFVMMLLLLIVSSSVLYYCEYQAQPAAFSSIPASMWWAVSTLTTVGYGDIYPVTVGGKICGGAIALLGVGMFALPTSVLGAGFLEATSRRKNRGPKCPHCGKDI